MSLDGSRWSCNWYFLIKCLVEERSRARDIADQYDNCKNERTHSDTWSICNCANCVAGWLAVGPGWSRRHRAPVAMATRTQKRADDNAHAVAVVAIARACNNLGASSGGGEQCTRGGQSSSCVRAHAALWHALNCGSFQLRRNHFVRACTRVRRELNVLICGSACVCVCFLFGVRV